MSLPPLPPSAQPLPQLPGAGWKASVRRIAPLAWPVLIGQWAVLAFATTDTLLLGRASAVDLAALAVGSAAYITIFVGLMGVVLAVGPIAGQQFGAREHAQAGHSLGQSLWLALGLSLLGGLLLLWPEPFLALARTQPEVEEQVRGYMKALAWALPPALMFTSYRGFNNAISRPKVVMALQLLSLLVKVPLSALLVFGFSLPALGVQVQAMGAVGCGVATAVAMWVHWAVAWVHLKSDRTYAPFALPKWVISQPDFPTIWRQIRLGVPMGGAILIEVTGFTFMAFFIARLGTTPVAGHQIAVNLVSLMFMLPLAWGNACSTLVAQRIGAQDLSDASRLGWHGLLVGSALSALVGGAVLVWREEILWLYSQDAAVVAAALPLLAWVALFHTADAAQTIAAYVLRAWQVTLAPVLIYAAAIWGVGLAGGYSLAFGHWENPTAAHFQGAPGFWAAATAGLTFAASGLTLYLWAMLRERRRERMATSGGSGA